MIYKKAWVKSYGMRTYVYEGWFLLGFIPLYVHRTRV